MKKFALALMAAAAAVFGAGMVANAYPPIPDSVTVSQSTVEPGGTFEVTAPCVVPEEVTFTFEGLPLDVRCTSAVVQPGFMLLQQSSPDGAATATLTAPTAAGTYTVTVTGSTSGSIGTATITVQAATDPGGGLPATGSDGISTTTMIAAGLLVVGLGLFGVATMRRRQAPVA